MFKTAFWVGLLYIVGFFSFAMAETMDQWGHLGSAALFEHVVRESLLWPMVAIQAVNSFT